MLCQENASHQRGFMFYARWEPATDLFRAGNNWLVRMELAGVSPAEIQMAAHRDVLHVKGRRRDLFLQGGYTCHTLEISYTDFERNITLPAIIDAASIRCEYRDGILRIYLSTL
jgi:HSP20 family protein